MGGASDKSRIALPQQGAGIDRKIAEFRIESQNKFLNAIP